jgi:transposase
VVQTYEELLQENKALKAENAALRKENAALKKENAALKYRVTELEGLVTQLLARVQELELQLKQNSQNSSRPPSSDPPSVQRPVKKSTGRKRGGQPGHEGHTRELLPPDKVDYIVPVKPPKCKHCGAGLPGEDPNPRRHQVLDIPKVKPLVTEYQLHTLPCALCGKETTADLPDGVPVGAFSPRIQATVSVCTGVYHLSKRTTQGLMEDFFGVEMALGSVSACEKAASEVLEKPVQEARAYVESQPVAYVDETSWCEGKKGKAWLWAAVTTFVTLFMVHASRGAKAAKELLGSFKGVLVSDRWKAYNAWAVYMRQLCWAHLKRNFQAFTERGGTAARVGHALLDEIEQMFSWWHRVRDGTLKRSTFRKYMGPLKRRVKGLLEEGTRSRNKKTAGTCRDVLKLAPALWTFVKVEGVEPTNNAAERAIRPGVLWRKGSFGTDSPCGSRFVERMMTVAASLKQQGRNVVDYITRAFEASLIGEPIPSLLPASDVTLLHSTAA